MGDHDDFWLWIGGASSALALTCVGIAGGLDASRQHYPFWTSAPMIVAYACGMLAILLFAAAVRGIPFPGAKADEETHAAERGERAPVPRIEFGSPRRTAPKAYRFLNSQGGTLRIGDPFSVIVIPVTARDNSIENCRTSVRFSAASVGYSHEVPGRWENRTAQPMQAFGQNLSELERTTFLKDDSDDVAV